jgi:hypothetical protein
LLHSLGLIDEETMAGLWAEARRRHRSLRQVLLASGTLTLYQLALIEAGNFERLILGPVRVLERVYADSHETAYRVMDPRRHNDGGVGLLRHLNESEMHDAVHPDEFRQRFGVLTTLQQGNLVATWEVLEIAQRPAVLQEWVSGTPASDWPAAAAIPAVWLRLVEQAALALHAGHQAGLVHGRLTGNSLVLTPLGTVKLLGLGEPEWLSGQPPSNATAQDDLATLGRLALGWAMLAPRRKNTKPKPPPEPVHSILVRLGALPAPTQEPVTPFADAAELLEALAQAKTTIADPDDGWDQLLNQLNASDAQTPPTLRQTA